jgi:hypothetical protein
VTDTDDRVIDLTGTDALFDRLLAGGTPEPDAPAWSREVALLVGAAQAPARPDELAAEDDIVCQMRQVRLEALAAEAATTEAASLPGGGVPVTDLGSYRARHSRHYRAKHAAERMAASRHPAVRTLGRVVAMKAAAITTAAVVGVAAAAATTGIVATVVVPALNRQATSEQAPTTTTVDRDGDARTGGGGIADVEAPDGERSEVACPASLPTCVAEPTPAPPAANASTTTTTTTVPPDDPAVVTPTTETPATTTTTGPPQTTVATEPPPTTTVPPVTQPEQSTTPFASS